MCCAMWQRYEMNSKGVEVFWKSWLPKPGTATKAALFFCHGYGSTCTFFFEGRRQTFIKVVYLFFRHTSDLNLTPKGSFRDCKDNCRCRLCSLCHGLPRFWALAGLAWLYPEFWWNGRPCYRAICSHQRSISYTSFGIFHSALLMDRPIMMQFFWSCAAMEGVRELRHFLLGQSMGGAVALKIHLKQPEEWDGVLLVAPMCKVRCLAHKCLPIKYVNFV